MAICLSTTANVESTFAFNAKDYLTASHLFRGFDEVALDELINMFRWRSLRAGEVLFSQGSTGDAFYLVGSGRLKIINTDHQNTVNLLGELGPGDTFGELALISNRPHMATVVALRDCELSYLEKGDFQAVLDRYPRLSLNIVTDVYQKPQPSKPRVKEANSTTIALMPLTTDVPLQLFSAQLKAALDKIGRTLYLSSDHLDGLLGPGSAHALHDYNPNNNQRKVARWLSIQEQQHPYVILQASAKDSAWTRFCCRHADKILYLACPQTTPLEQLADREYNTAADDELVLLYENNSIRPNQTGRWLEHLSVNTHHHVRASSAEDYARLARHLSGTGIGLVLGAGGARGFAHLGVLQAMHELGIPVDYIGGCSMGAVIGAQYAAGYTLPEIIELNRQIWVKNKPHRQFTLPIISLLSNGVAVKGARYAYGELAIEDLWRDFFCISTNLTDAELHTHRRGTVWEAVMSSTAVPGICPPMITPEGKILVDGCMLNSLPVDVMRQHVNGKIIAVNVLPPQKLAANTSTTEPRPPKSWQALLENLNPRHRRRRLPNILELLHKSLLLPGQFSANRSQGMADLYLSLPVADYAPFEMNALDRLIERGYRHAYPSLESWWQDYCDAVSA